VGEAQDRSAPHHGGASTRNSARRKQTSATHGERPQCLGKPLMTAIDNQIAEWARCIALCDHFLYTCMFTRIECPATPGIENGIEIRREDDAVSRDPLGAEPRAKEGPVARAAALQ
jgi:hypothetical protein